MDFSDQGEPSHDGRLDFVTLGMFIIDEIHFPPPRQPEIDVLGGAGSWSVLGARLFREPPASRKIGWIVHKGSDFPASIEEQIETWDTSCHLIDTPERLTTRGWNSYGDDEARAFEYTTPKIRIDQHQLTDEQLLAKCFHLICTATRCIDLVEGIMQRRQALLDSDKNTLLARRTLPRPIFVWEPVPNACNPGELESTLKAIPLVDIVSPNHQELAAFFEQKDSDSTTAAEQTNEQPNDHDGNSQDMSRILEQSRHLLQAWPSSSDGHQQRRGTVVVRCGEAGCLWMSGDGSWHVAKPYHQPGGSSQGLGEPGQVVDPTGAGNAFLGGFCVGMVDESVGPETRLARAVRCGLAAASFAIEQVGLPRRTLRHGQEEWNGDVVQRRLLALEKAAGVDAAAE